MKVTKIIPKTIPILILLQEKRKIWCEIGQKTLYLVVLGGYAYTLGVRFFLQTSYKGCNLSLKVAKCPLSYRKFHLFNGIFIVF